VWALQPSYKTVTLTPIHVVYSGMRTCLFT